MSIHIVLHNSLALYYVVNLLYSQVVLGLLRDTYGSSSEGPDLNLIFHRNDALSALSFVVADICSATYARAVRVKSIGGENYIGNLVAHGFGKMASFDDDEDQVCPDGSGETCQEWDGNVMGAIGPGIPLRKWSCCSRFSFQQFYDNNIAAENGAFCLEEGGRNVLH